MVVGSVKSLLLPLLGRVVVEDVNVLVGLVGDVLYNLHHGHFADQDDVGIETSVICPKTEFVFALSFVFPNVSRLVLPLQAETPARIRWHGGDGWV